MLTENGMPFNPEWFAGTDGKAIERSCYEYIRDFLGYHISAKNAEISKAGRFTEIKLKLINYGFSAPHSMKSCDIVLLDKDNNIIAARPACKLSELQSGNEVTCETYFDGDISAAVRRGKKKKSFRRSVRTGISPRLMAWAMVTISDACDCRNISSNRTVAKLPLSIRSFSTRPAPTLGS